MSKLLKQCSLQNHSIVKKRKYILKALVLKAIGPYAQENVIYAYETAKGKHHQLSILSLILNIKSLNGDWILGISESW